MHAKIGKVNGNSFPKIRKEKQSILVVDASYGFAYPAFDLMITNLSKLTSSSLCIVITVALIHILYH